MDGEARVEKSALYCVFAKSEILRTGGRIVTAEMGASSTSVAVSTGASGRVFCGQIRAGEKSFIWSSEVVGGARSMADRAGACSDQK